MRSTVVTATLALIVLSAAALAAPTRTEAVRPSRQPEDDLKANSSAVPEALALSSAFQRVVVVRLKYQADLLAGLEKMVQEQKIRNAVILAGIGSVRSYHFHDVGSRTFPSKDVYVKDPEAAADIVGMNGYVIGGRIHAHITLADDQKAFGGHLEPETQVYTFAIVTLGVLGDEVDLSRVDDKAYR